MKIQTNFWPLLALIAAAGIFLAMLSLTLDSPLPRGWDEAVYHQRAYQDAHAFREGGFRKLVSALRWEDPYRPPAYRIFVLPWNLTRGVSPLGLKAHAIFFWALTIAALFMAGKTLGGRDTGAFAALFITLSPVVIYTSKLFLTEYPLYLAVALLLWSVCKFVREGENPAALALFTAGAALGGLSKPTFLLLFAPIVLGLIFYGLKDKTAKPRPLTLLGLTALAAVPVLAWWLPHAGDVVHHGVTSTLVFDRHSLGSDPTPGKLWALLRLGATFVLGPALAVVALGLALVCFFCRKQFDAADKKALDVLFLAAAPSATFAIFGLNNNPRYLAPALFPLALGLGLVAGRTGRLRGRQGLLLSAFFILQFAVLVWPASGNARYQKPDDEKTVLIGNYTNVFRRPEQWDWEALYQLVSKRVSKKPVIGELGMGPPFNPPQIGLPWVRRNEPADVRMIWRYESGDFGAEQALAAAEACDVVVTIPGYVGKRAAKNELDNAHNEELSLILTASGKFEEPVVLEIGKWETARALVFFRKTAVN